MDTETSKILLHPLRLRIVLAFGSEQLTTSELAARLPDVAHATLYRQVAVLAEAGLLDVVAERQIRGGVERTYAATARVSRLDPDTKMELTLDELYQGFVVFAGSLIEAFGRYAAEPNARPKEDAVSYRQAGLWLDEDELAELVARLRAAITPYLEHGPSGDRQRLLLSTILVPDVTAQPERHS